MIINEFHEIPIYGSFDLLFKEHCPPKTNFNWKLLKSLAFNESELYPSAEGGLFRTPERLYYEYDGINIEDPADNIKVMVRILNDWWYSLDVIPEQDRLLFVILAYKLKFYDAKSLTDITHNFEEFYNYFSPGLVLDVKRIIELSGVM